MFLSKSFITIVALFIVCRAITSDAITSDQIITNLFASYDEWEPPPQKPTVRNEIWVNRVNSIDENKRELSFDVFFSQRWLDSRLNFATLSSKKFLRLNRNHVDNCWTPRVNFLNTHTAQAIVTPSTGAFALLYSNGTMWINRKMRLTAPCQFSSVECPGSSCQKAVCSVYFSSFLYGYTDMRMELRHDAVVIMGRPKTKEWALRGVGSTVLEKFYAQTGVYEDVTVEFTFHRHQE